MVWVSGRGCTGMSGIAKKMMQAAAGQGGAVDAATLAFFGGGNKIHSIDAEDANALSRLQEFDVNLVVSGFDPSEGVSFDVNTSVLYAVSASADGIVSIDASDPSAMSVLDNITYDSDFDRADAIALDAERSVLFYGASSMRRIRSVDVSAPSVMSTLQTLSLQAGYGNVKILCLDVARSLLFCSYNEISTSNYGVLTIDVSNPSSMSVGDVFLISGLGGPVFNAGALDVENNVLYATYDETSAVYAIDVSNPSSMSVLSSFTDTDLSNLKGLFVDVFNGGVCYVVSGSGSNKIVALDVSNPSSISKISSFSSGTMIEPECICCDVVSQVAYVGCNAGGSATENIHSIDISTSSAMSILDTVGSIVGKAVILNVAGLEANNSL